MLADLGVFFRRIRALLASGEKPARGRFTSITDRRDSADQLRDVLAASVTVKKVMTPAEYQVFKAAEDVARELRAGHRVFSQTCLGEIIKSQDKRAHSAINSKRVDVLIISPFGFPEVVVEYQGGRHYQNDAAARDAVKKEALRRAGVEYVEVFAFHTEDAMRQLVREALARKSARVSAIPEARSFPGHARAS
jgi:hypothetical protein